MSTQTRAKKATVSIIDGTLVFQFAYPDAPAHKVDPSAFSADVQAQARLSGFRQTLQDSYAATKGMAPQEAEAIFLKRLETLQAGEWQGARAPGQAFADLVSVVASISGKDATEVAAVLSDDAAAKAARKMPQVALALKKLEMERLEAKAEASGDSIAGLFS